MEPKRLTQDELDEALHMMDEKRHPKWAAKIRGHIAALSSVPEDVARDGGKAREALEVFAGWAEKQRAFALLELARDGVSALSRLATAAAMSQHNAAIAARREEQAVAAESARDAARQEAADLQKQVDAWKESCGLVGSSGDPEDVAPVHLSADLQKRDAENARLTARVAELERELTNLRTDVQVVWGQKVTAAEARATAAEVKVAEMEATVRGQRMVARDDATARAEMAQKVRALEERLIDLGYCTREDHKLDEHDEHGQHPFCGAGTPIQPAPTPAPGLREAVARVLEAERVTYGIGNPEGISVAIPYEALRSLRAAYDTTPASTFSATRVEWTPDGRVVRTDCAAAHSEPVATHAQLAAAVETYAKGMESDGNDYEYSRAEGAREVLRRVTGGEVPEVLAKARVVEVLSRHITPLVGTSYSAAVNAVVTSCSRDLGLTLPTGPGGGETDGLDVVLAKVRDVEWEAEHRRARIAPTPTPEGPALAEDPPSCFTPEWAEANAPKDEPAAPEVVWEDPRGFRVMPYGADLVLECQMDDGTWDELDVQTPKAAVMFAQSLARALAEAKLDARLARASLASREEALRQTDKALAEAKREAQTRLDLWSALNDRMGDVNERVRKAAEDMRERCLSLIWERIKEGKDDTLRGAWDAIRALPL